MRNIKIMPTLTDQQKIDILVQALSHYAIAANWGETASFGSKKPNRFLGRGDGSQIALDALAEIGIDVESDEAEIAALQRQIEAIRQRLSSRHPKL